MSQAPELSSADSYSAGGRCYCLSDFSGGVGDIEVLTPVGPRTVQAVCESLGPGPGPDGFPQYNDVQCGNGPNNGNDDETQCPGRVDQGVEGCCTIGPTWDLTLVE